MDSPFALDFSSTVRGSIVMHVFKEDCIIHYLQLLQLNVHSYPTRYTFSRRTTPYFIHTTPLSYTPHHATCSPIHTTPLPYTLHPHPKQYMGISLHIFRARQQLPTLARRSHPRITGKPGGRATPKRASDPLEARGSWRLD